MCEGFSQLGLDVVLYFLKSPALNSDVYEYYDIRYPFRLKPLPRAFLPFRKNFDPRNAWDIFGFVHAFAWAAVAATFVVREKPVFCYVRDPLVAWWTSRLNQVTVVEIHSLPGRVQKYFLSKAAKHSFVKLVIVVTNHLQRDLQEMAIVPQGKCIVLHDGVDLDRFSTAITKEEARNKLDLPHETHIILYTGSLYENRGVENLIKAAVHLDSYTVLVVGGSRDEAEHTLLRLARKLGTRNILHVPQVLPAMVPLYLKAADILVLPETSCTHTARHASPLKLFEYMASGVPIVASDLPALREILQNGINALLVPPDDPSGMILGIHKLLGDSDFAKILAKNARERVKEYTWTKRASTILEHVLK
jgi:glycosyltransferase involved in cell wall biosynthesis